MKEVTMKQTRKKIKCKKECTASVVVDIGVMVSCNKKITLIQQLSLYPSERRVTQLIRSDVS